LHKAIFFGAIPFVPHHCWHNIVRILGAYEKRQPYLAFNTMPRYTLNSFLTKTLFWQSSSSGTIFFIDIWKRRAFNSLQYLSLEGKGFSSWLWICAFNNSFKTLAPSLVSFRLKSLLWKLSLTTQNHNRLRVLDCAKRVLGTLSLWQATTLPLELLKILCTGKVMEVWSCASNFRQLLYISDRWENILGASSFWEHQNCKLLRQMPLIDILVVWFWLQRQEKKFLKKLVIYLFNSQTFVLEYLCWSLKSNFT